jgi:hypothetical protein
MLRLYLDEDSMSHALTATLRNLGVDVLTALDAGTIAAPDSMQLEFATSQQRVLYSFNVGDFYRLHSEFLGQGKSHAGIVLCHQTQFSVGEQARRIVALANAISPDDMCDRVEFLGAWA